MFYHLKPKYAETESFICIWAAEECCIGENQAPFSTGMLKTLWNLGKAVPCDPFEAPAPAESGKPHVRFFTGVGGRAVSPRRCGAELAGARLSAGIWQTVEVRQATGARQPAEARPSVGARRPTGVCTCRGYGGPRGARARRSAAFGFLHSRRQKKRGPGGRASAVHFFTSGGLKPSP